MSVRGLNPPTPPHTKRSSSQGYIAHGSKFEVWKYCLFFLHLFLVLHQAVTRIERTPTMPRPKQRIKSSANPGTKFCQNPSKIHPKSSQNPPKMHPYRSKIVSKIDTGSQTGSKTVPNTIFSIFWWFLGGPGTTQNGSKIEKNEEKSMSTKHMFFNTIFSRFFFVLASENDSKIEVFSHFFRKRRFCENRAPVEAPCIFSGFGASQNRPKIDAKTRSKKASKKNVPKLDFGLRFGLPNPPKIQKSLSKTPSENLSKK